MSHQNDALIPGRTRIDRETLKKLVAQCKPDDPIDSDDDRYVNKEILRVDGATRA